MCFVTHLASEYMLVARYTLGEMFAHTASCIFACIEDRALALMARVYSKFGSQAGKLRGRVG
jgi:hypothetical protein